MWRTPIVPRNTDLPSVRPRDLADGPPGRKMSSVAPAAAGFLLCSRDTLLLSHVCGQLSCAPEGFWPARYAQMTLVGLVPAGHDATVDVENCAGYPAGRLGK